MNIRLTKITAFQLFALVILNQVGFNVLTIPFPQSHDAGYDAWLSILLGGVWAQLIILVIYWLCTRYPDMPLPQSIRLIAGQAVGTFLNLIIAIYCLESSLLIIVSYADVINRWVLYATPWSVLIGISIFIAAYVASSTLRVIATITQTIILMFLLCLILIFISGMGKGSFLHFLPMGAHGLGPILKASLPAFWVYAGYELLLYVFPYVDNRSHKKTLLVMTAANGATTFLYVMVALIVTHNFNESQLSAIPEPLIFLLRQFNWPVMQSLDILMIAVWFSITTVTAYVYLFLAARYFAFIRKSEIRRHGLLVFIFAVIMFLAGLWGSDRSHIHLFSNYHNIATVVVVAAMPAILLIVSLARGKKGSME
ncbi:GerAB/ArcD/ProY family transporter [Paenibacillus sp. PL2-23]|uniref:GerAB/ArcD/ProY family transporter n=1 Tax=Paenibacillus sp. PL2-23 TaxID=2100729 RepID=UPI0030F9EB0A